MSSLSIKEHTDMGKMLTISIAAYNVEQFLDRTINSLIVDAAIDDLEVIIVNDGSIDSTSAIAEKYELMYPNSIKVVNKENGGYGSTINTAVRMATGKYFKQLDGDDWYETENIGKYVEYLRTVDSDIVITPYYKCFSNSDKKVLDDKHEHIDISTTDICDIQIKSNLLMHEVTFKTSLLINNNIHITEGCFYTDNEYTILPLLNASSISRFPYPIYCYQLGVEGQSVSLEGVRKHYKDNVKVAVKIYKYYLMKKNNLCESVKNYMESIKINSLTRNAYSAYMILEHPVKHKKEIVSFDRFIKKKYPEIYKITMQSRRVAILRYTHFFGYGFFCKHAVKEFTSD